MEEHPVLCPFTFSHFNEKARWALDYKGIRHVRHPLVPGFHASTVRKMTGQTAMPVLQMNGGRSTTRRGSSPRSKRPSPSRRSILVLRPSARAPSSSRSSSTRSSGRTSGGSDFT